MYNIQSEKFYTGDTFSWSESFSDYSASSYSVACYLKHANDNLIIIPGTADGTDFNFEYSSEESAILPAGAYRFTYVATKNSDSSKKQIAADYITITQGLHAQQVGDIRGYWEKTRDLLKTSYENMAENDYAEIALPNGVNVKWDRMQLLKELRLAEYECSKEIRRASGKKGLRTYKVKL